MDVGVASRLDCEEGNLREKANAMTPGMGWRDLAGVRPDLCPLCSHSMRPSFEDWHCLIAEDCSAGWLVTCRTPNLELPIKNRTLDKGDEGSEMRPSLSAQRLLSSPPPRRPDSGSLLNTVSSRAPCGREVLGSRGRLIESGHHPLPIAR